MAASGCGRTEPKHFRLVELYQSHYLCTIFI